MNPSTAMSRIGVSTLVAIACCRLASGDAPPLTETTASEIKMLLRLNGSADLATQLGPAMGQVAVGNLRKTNPGLSAHTQTAVYTAVEKYVREQADQDSLIDLLVPVYAKYLTKHDIDQLILFYQSPVGKKLASVTPAISFESAKVGQQWAESLAPGLQTKLAEVLKNEK
jgi:hypothetical protein